MYYKFRIKNCNMYKDGFENRTIVKQIEKRHEGCFGFLKDILFSPYEFVEEVKTVEKKFNYPIRIEITSQQSFQCPICKFNNDFGITTLFNDTNRLLERVENYFENNYCIGYEYEKSTHSKTDLWFSENYKIIGDEKTDIWVLNHYPIKHYDYVENVKREYKRDRHKLLNLSVDEIKDLESNNKKYEQYIDKVIVDIYDNFNEKMNGLSIEDKIQFLNTNINRIKALECSKIELYGIPMFCINYQLDYQYKQYEKLVKDLEQLKDELINE